MGRVSYARRQVLAVQLKPPPIKWRLEMRYIQGAAMLVFAVNDPAPNQTSGTLEVLVI